MDINVLTNFVLTIVYMSPIANMATMRNFELQISVGNC